MSLAGWDKFFQQEGLGESFFALPEGNYLAMGQSGRRNGKVFCEEESGQMPVLSG